MEEFGIFLLGFVAVACHWIAGYHWIFKPTFAQVKLLNANNGKERIPFSNQERSAFIFLPLLGYLAYFVLREFDNGMGFQFVPTFVLLQAISFGAYFYSRRRVVPKSVFEIIFIPSLLVLGVLTCLILAFKLFYYYLICITIGWIFIILPLCMMAYYALFQVIAFQIAELIKILKFTRSNFDANNAVSFPMSFKTIYFGQLYLLSQMLSCAILLVGLYVLFLYVGGGYFQLKIWTLLEMPSNFIF